MIFKQKKRHNNQHPKEDAYILLNNQQGKSHFEYAEPYRNIRTNIEFSISDRQIKSIVVTSTQPNEAKTTTAINLATVFANKYKKVLIIDCDLRKSRLHKYLHLSNQFGLSNALKDFSTSKKINEKFFQKVENPNLVGTLSVLTSGKKVSNPNEVLSSTVFQNYIKELREIYDYIIIDCPPVLTISDAIPVGHAADGTLFVYSCKDTKKQDAFAALNLLKQNNVYILGTILTKVNTYSEKYYHYYYED